MKLNCAVTRDLYVLYEEKELSPEVKGYVDEHLRECAECREIYKNGSGLPDVFKEEEGINELSKKTDEKLLLKLKLSRLKIASVFFLMLILMVFFNIYTQSRTFLVRDFQEYSGDVWHYKFHVEALKHHEKIVTPYSNTYNNFAGTTLTELNKNYELVERNLNLFEKIGLKKQYTNQCFDLSMTTLILTLNNRWENGYWSDKDEEVYKRLLSELDALSSTTSNYGNKLNSKFYMVDTKKLKESYDKLNDLALSYTKYNKLPEEIKYLSKDELKEKVSYVLGTDFIKMDFVDKKNGSYDFRTPAKAPMCYGEIDALTGKIISFSEEGGPEGSGEMIDLEKAKDRIKEITKRNLGEDIEAKIEYLGINANYHSSSDIKVYCFKVQPSLKGYSIFEELNVNIDARSNKTLEYQILSFKPSTPLPNLKELNTEIKYSPKEALNGLTSSADDRSTFQYKETRFIKSMFSGEYVLTHYYKQVKNDKGNTMDLFINTLTGKEEWPAYSDGMITY